MWHNCWIGITNSYYQIPENNIYVEDLAVILREVTDRRRGQATLFNYCPECGKKIDWKKLRREMI
uniref:Uncharacterized protein n=1 Tax=viral metagenome TaxID=1070528 RepID=A0A6M3IHE4_9ZZZZ